MHELQLPARNAPVVFVAAANAGREVVLANCDLQFQLQYCCSNFSIVLRLQLQQLQ